MIYWKVYRNGNDTGIRESNYMFASSYWARRARVTGALFILKPVNY